jgi:ParB-like chromosome segregation protein Spo0J
MVGRAVAGWTGAGDSGGNLMQVDIRDIKTIKTAKYNPRKISDQQMASLKQSIERFGFVDPVIVNDRTGTLVGGHQRIKAAKDLGLKQVPVVGVNLDEAEEKALNVALNKISGEWDIDLLKGVLDEVQASGLDLSLTGFTEDEWLDLESGIVPIEEMPELKTGEKDTFQEISFVLHDNQAEVVRQAIECAKDMGPFIETGNINSNGNAISRVCELFMSWGNDRAFR